MREVGAVPLQTKALEVGGRGREVAAPELYASEALEVG